MVKFSRDFMIYSLTVFLVFGSSILLTDFAFGSLFFPYLLSIM